MEKKAGIQWLFLDLNSYFASVEQQERPHLIGKPVAVVPMETDATCAIAASYEAKKYGIKTGTKIYEAKKLCPDLTCVLARHDVYVDYHHRILKEVDRHIPVHKVWSIDELSARLQPSEQTVEAMTDLAMRIKAGLRANVGEAVTCSIGVAPNSLLAKIATDMRKPDGLTIITQEDLPGPLLDLKLGDIPGVGFNMERRLNAAGIGSIRQFWDISPKHARKIWGSVNGERLWYWLHGYDFEAPETGKTSMVGHSRVLDPQFRVPVQARLMARRLLFKATARLRRKGYYAHILSLGVRSVQGHKWRQEVRLNSPARDPFTFMGHLDDLWDRMMSDFSGVRHVRFKKVSTLLMGLSQHGDVTYDLLEQSQPMDQEKLRKRESLAQALDHLQDRYKGETVTVGLTPKTSAGHVGTKIAFSRVPDREEFWS